MKLFFALITDPTRPGLYPAQAKHAITLKSSQGNGGGEHDTLIAHQAFSFSMVYCSGTTLPSSNQDADVFVLPI